MNRITALLKGSAVITFGTVIGGILSYVYSSVMGRMLGPADFGDLGAINSYFLLTTAISGGLLTVTMYFVSNLFAKKDIAGISYFHQKFSKVVVLGSVLITMLALFSIPYASKFFAINNQQALGLALSSIVLALVLTVNRGVLQGTQRFDQLAVSNITEYLVKLIAAVIFIKVGMGLSGATFSIFIGSLGALTLSWVVLKRMLKGETTVRSKGEYFPQKREVLLYFLPALASNFALLLLMNIDVLLAKKFFLPEIAGQYVAVSTVAKIIFYISGPITSVMFPLIAAQRSRGEKHVQTLFGAILITLIGSGVLLVLYALFDREIVRVLYGNDYLELASLLSISAVLVISLSLVNLMSQYFLSIQRYWFIAEMLVIGLILITYTSLKIPQNVAVLLDQLRLGFIALLGVMVVDYLILKRNQLKSLLFQR